MKNIKKRIIWVLLLLIAWIALIINKNKSKTITLAFIKELKELCKKHSKYIEELKNDI